jgi:hypothetical protein
MLRIDEFLRAALKEPVTMSFATVNGSATTSDNDYVAKTTRRDNRDLTAEELQELIKK